MTKWHELNKVQLLRTFDMREMQQKALEAAGIVEICFAETENKNIEMETAASSSRDHLINRISPLVQSFPNTDTHTRA